MNTILESLYHRKSCRVFTDEAVSADLKQELIRAAMQSPTAGNMHLYSIIDITDQHIKDQLAESCDHQAFIAKAPLVFVFCADYHRAWQGMKTFIDQETRKPEIGDMFLAMSDALICAQNMVVAAQGLGLGSCYIGDILENYEFHKDLLKLPQAVWPIGMLVLGYPTQHQLERQKPKRFEPSFVVHSNAYQALGTKDQQTQIDELFKDHPKPISALNYYDDLYHRKYTADFTHEMNRSVSVMIETLLSTK